MPLLARPHQVVGALEDLEVCFPLGAFNGLFALVSHRLVVLFVGDIRNVSWTSYGCSASWARERSGGGESKSHERSSVIELARLGSMKRVASKVKCDRPAKETGMDDRAFYVTRFCKSGWQQECPPAARPTLIGDLWLGYMNAGPEPGLAGDLSRNHTRTAGTDRQQPRRSCRPPRSRTRRILARSRVRRIMPG